MKIIKPLSNHDIAADFVAVYQETVRTVVLSSKTTPHRVLSLRPSQMPFCPLEFYVHYSTKGLYRVLDLAGAFYTSVGTTVHEVMQNYLCKSGRFLADYHCRECDTWHRMSYKHECCGFPTEYHEAEIHYKGVEGHIDAIYRDRHGRLWILDFKTTSISAAPGKKRDPGIVYREQIEVYAVLLELQYGLKIEGFMDGFILRDNPTKDPVVWSRKLTDDIRAQVKRRLARYRKMQQAALDARTLDDARALFKFGRCENPDCKTCKLSDVKLKKALVAAHEVGTRSKRIPIRELAERELSNIAKRKARSK